MGVAEVLAAKAVETHKVVVRLSCNYYVAEVLAAKAVETILAYNFRCSILKSQRY